MSREHKADLKEAVTQILSCALQADSEIQRLAEERKKAFEMIDDYPFILVEIIQSTDEAQAEKHMASVFLKNYLHDFFVEKKDIDRHSKLLSKLSVTLVEVLTHEYIYIKKMICKSLAYLVYKGFWACINSKIMSMMLSDNEEVVFAAVLFLKHLLDPYQCLNIPITAEYFEVLLNIYQRNYPSALRLETISSMSFLIVYSMKNQPNLQRDAVSRVSQVYERTLEEGYSVMNDFQLKSEVIKGINLGLDLIPEIGSAIIMPNLPLVGQLLTNCCHEYKKIVTNSSTIPRDANEDEQDPNNFNDLINNILNLVNDLITTPDYAEMLMNGLDNLLYCLFVFMACYDDMELTLFMEDEEKSVVFPIRNNATDTLTAILLSLQEGKLKLFFQSLHNVFQKHMNEASLERNNSELYYFRIQESLMYGLGVLRYYFSKNSISNELFPFSYYLESWSSLIRSESNFVILGRLYWLGSRYSASLSPDTLTVHLKALIAHFQTNFKLLYAPCAEALKNHLAVYEFSRIDNQTVISNCSNDLAVTLFLIREKLPNNPKLFLNGMGNLIKYHEKIGSLYAHDIQNLLIDTIISNFSDVSVLQEVNFVLKSLAVHDSCMQSLQTTLIPFILKLIYNNPPERLRGRRDICEKGLEFVNILAIYGTEPMNEYVLIESFHASCKVLLENEDCDVSLTEAAVSFITTAMIKLLPQLKNLRDSKGCYLTEYIPKILFEILDPMKCTLTNKVGRFCVISIMTLNEQLEPNIEQILKSVLSAFQLNKVNNSQEKMKALMLIFAYIFMCRPENTTNFLSSIPGPYGGSALAYLFQKWRKDFVINTGKFEKTINAMAITQIIQFAFDGNIDKINGINVQIRELESKELTGIEFLFYLLISLLVTEDSEQTDIELKLHEKPRHTHQQAEDDYLFKCHPCSNINITSYIKNFLKNYTPYYYNMVRSTFHYSHVEKLQKFGIISDLPME